MSAPMLMAFAHASQAAQDPKPSPLAARQQGQLWPQNLQCPAAVHSTRLMLSSRANRRWSTMQTAFPAAMRAVTRPVHGQLGTAVLRCSMGIVEVEMATVGDMSCWRVLCFRHAGDQQTACSLALLTGLGIMALYPAGAPRNHSHAARGGKYGFWTQGHFVAENLGHVSPGVSQSCGSNARC